MIHARVRLVQQPNESLVHVSDSRLGNRFELGADNPDSLLDIRYNFECGSLLDYVSHKTVGCGSKKEETVIEIGCGRFTESIEKHRRIRLDSRRAQH
jgi:hypothetical protein